MYDEIHGSDSSRFAGGGVGATCLLAVMIAGLPVICAKAAFADEKAVYRWDFETPGDLEGWSAGLGLGSLAVGDGCLRLEINAADSFVIGPEVSVPLDGCVIRVRLRADRNGHTQVYWTTDDYPAFGEQQQLSRMTFGSTASGDPSRAEGFVTLEFPVGKPGDLKRTLRRFRVDAANGPKVSRAEIDYVEVVRVEPQMDATWSSGRHCVGTGEPLALRLRMTQTGGRAERATFEVHLPGNDRQKVSVTADTPQEVSCRVRPVKPGVYSSQVIVQSSNGRICFDLQTTTVVGQDDSLPLVEGLRGKQCRIDLIPSADHRGLIGGARWSVKQGVDGEAGDWRQAGWLLPLAQLCVRTDEGRMIRREPTLSILEKNERQIRLEGPVVDLAGYRMEITFDLNTIAGREMIDVIVRMEGPAGGQLLDLSGPVLRVASGTPGDPFNRFALFGGLEFLEPGWRSSSERAVGERFADRWTPHPYKVTLPVMAVETGGLTSAMMWQPLESWDETDALPAATFASPNFIDGQPNHLMKLSVPTTPKWREENESCARMPYVLKGQRPLAIRSRLYAESGLPVGMIAKRWYQFYRAPVPPPNPHDDRALYDIMIRCFADTMYWPDEKGWRHHWYLNHDTGYKADIAAALVAHAAETGEQKWVEKTGLVDRTVIDAAGPLARRIGNDAAVRQRMASMRPDGTWPFQNNQQIRELALRFSEGKYDSLGEDGSTSLGTCVQPALVILRHAKLTGDAACVQAGLKALEAMRQFRVPRGAQVWEVHQQIPDIRAAALAVEAFQIGYQLTGDGWWLDEASYWAWTGVPFLYSWRVPVERRAGTLVATRDRDDWDRFSIPLEEAYQNGQPQVVPYGSLPVFGPSFYAVNWFGVIVQWCGLEWALKVIELDADRPDPLLRYIADGVVQSGLQQVMDKGPWLGLYPDSWHTQPNIAHAALIFPGLPLRCLGAQERLPRWGEPWTRILHGQSGHRWHVSGWGRPIELEKPIRSGIWSALVAFLADQPSEIILAGVDRPAQVRADNQLVPKADKDLAAKAAGWRYDPERRILAIRFLHADEHAELRVDW